MRVSTKSYMFTLTPGSGGNTMCDDKNIQPNIPHIYTDISHMPV